MQDMQAYLEKLSTVAVDCALISKRATDAQKKELFDRLGRVTWICDRPGRTGKRPRESTSAPRKSTVW